ncbi:MAG: proline dehydrogenase family protein, partial [Nitrospiria bacterium]
MTSPDLEPEIQRIGRELLERMGDRRASIFDVGRWGGQMMDWAIRDERFKVALFRFVDVLPTVSDPSDAIALFAEYFEGLPLPKTIEWGLKRLAPDSMAGRLAGRAIKEQVASLAAVFIAADSIEGANRAAVEAWRLGRGVSIALLGEAALSEAEADAYGGRYRRLIDVLADAADASPATTGSPLATVPRANISIKPSSLDARIDPADRTGSLDRLAVRLRPILQSARERGAHVHIDMEHDALKDLLLALFRRLLDEPEFADLDAGIVIQAYLRDAERDVRELIEWAERRAKPITVRLVKGAYWDEEVTIARRNNWPIPVWTEKATTDLRFEALTRLLVDHAPAVRPAIGSHNVRSLATAIAAAQRRGLSPSEYELQLLYGMGEPIAAALAEMGFGVRLYTPVGELIPGMAYLVRRLLENSANESFLRRRFQERLSPEALLAAPAPPGPAPASSSAADRFTNEPPADFAEGDAREAMRRAIERERAALDREWPLIIDGHPVTTGRTTASYNPAAPSERVGKIASAAREHADRALAAAARARATWRRVAVDERAAILRRTASLMRERRFDLAALEVLEVGKSWHEADGDVVEAVDFLEYYAREMLRLGRVQTMGDAPGEANRYGYEPRGIGFIVAPWNFPLAIPAGMIAAAVVAGNPALFKPSGLSPVIGARLVELFHEAGLPPGVLQFLPGPGGDVGEYLVEHPEVDFITFTGSKDVGLRIIERAGRTPPGQRHVKRVIAEMGGKNAIIVDRTADPDQAIPGILTSAFGYQGQKCSACSRLIVIEAMYDAFVPRLTAAVAGLAIGSPEDPACHVGPVIDAAARDRILAMIERGVADGLAVRVVSPPASPGYYIPPALFGPVPPDHPLAREEIFGPVLSILVARDFEHALALANDSEYALTGGLYSRSPAHIRRAVEAFEVGNLYVNRPTTGAVVGRQPFGGFRLSGIGSKAGGPDYLPQFLLPKSWSENTTRHGFAPP